MTTTYYVTTPIYYVNDVPHIGHAYTTLAADVLARYYRLKGCKTYFLTGTDEHGLKMYRAAEQKGISVQELADKNSDKFKNLWEALGISYDDFIRTTEKRHEKGVIEFYNRLDPDDIYPGEYEGLYCTPDETYYTELQLVDGKCPMCGRPVEKVKEKSYFFRMSRYQDKLLSHIDGNPDFILPEARRNEIRSFIKEGLRDLSISRTSFDWGIPLPDDPAHVLYVWVDALVNYISALGFGHEDDSKFQEFWPANVHLIGKDILRHHAVIWPCLLMSAGIELPQTVFAHGWWTHEGQKMSKSLDNFIDPYEVVNTYGLDQFRYFVLREVPFGSDGDFSDEAIKHRINSELANDLGNLLSRTAGMAGKYFKGEVKPPGPPEGPDQELIEAAAEASRQVDREMEACGFGKSLIAIWSFIGKANKYIDTTKPFSLAKEEGQEQRLATVMYNLAEVLRITAILVYPFMPGSAENMWEQIGMEGSPADPPLEEKLKWGGVKPGTVMKKGKSLFPRIEE
ncbi:MAG: methionine--tRNA ligase [bacterium]